MAATVKTAQPRLPDKRDAVFAQMRRRGCMRSRGLPLYFHSADDLRRQRRPSPAEQPCTHQATRTQQAERGTNEQGPMGSRTHQLFVARERRSHNRSRPPARLASAQAKARLPALKGRSSCGLAHAQDDQRHKLKQQARSVENQVDGDQPFKRQLEREPPGQPAEQHADPRNAAALASCQRPRAACRPRPWPWAGASSS